MVKVQKLNPKSIKKNVPAITRNIQKKKTNVNLPKVELIEKTVKNVSKNKKFTEGVKTKSVVVNKNFKTHQEKGQTPLVKKRPAVQTLQQKKPSAVQTIQQTKQPIVRTIQQKKRPVQTLQQKKEKLLSKKQAVIKTPLKKNLAVKSKFKKNQKKHALQNGEKVEKKNEIISPIYEPSDFDEGLFKNIVSLENVKKISTALKNLVEEEVSKRNTSIFSDFKYLLNIASYKIPNCPKRMVKLNVKHSLVDLKLDDVVMIVPDLKRGAKVDFEPTIQHYEDLLREQKVENIKVVPFNQLRMECTTFEAKRKFANTYDYFMCDGRIVDHAVGFCGKIFQRPRNTFHSVRLSNPKTYKDEITRALKRTSFKQLKKGDLTSIPVGNHRFTINQLAENIEMVIDQLKTLYPGGYANIHNIYLKIDIAGTSSLPLYVNLVGAPQETPNVIGPREQLMLKLKKKANNILSKFSMSKSGEFVKLNKTQIERKKQFHKARLALLSEENVEVNDDNDNEIKFKPHLKKVKKDKQIKEEDKSDEGEECDDSDDKNEDDEEVEELEKENSDLSDEE